MLVTKYSFKHVFLLFFFCFFLDKKITINRPVVVSVSKAVENGGSQMSISFFISANTVLPEPNDETIRIKELPAATVYVR